MADIKELILDDFEGRTDSSGWRAIFEESFPDPTQPNFFNRVRRNYLSVLKTGCFHDFYNALKMSNRRLRTYNIFLLWLHLCLTRPWRNGLPFKWSTRIYFEKIIDILNNLESPFPIPFPDDYRGEEAIIGYRKDEFIRLAIHEAFLPDPFDDDESTKHLKHWISEGLDEIGIMKLLLIEQRFQVVLLHEHVIKARDLQRKFHLDSDFCGAVISFAEKAGWIKLKRRYHNSVWIILKENKWEIPTEYKEIAKEILSHTSYVQNIRMRLSLLGSLEKPALSRSAKKRL